MSSEWLKVMLEEISRKKAEAEQARVEDQTRLEEQTRVEEQGRVEEAARSVVESAACAREKKVGDAE
ncbi:MAG TPA: hypothetical protein VKG63_10765 [Steroidobacteraceae bacterium]|nr:hypothetical protein [Steroidobacteraceae bacterium]